MNYLFYAGMAQDLETEQVGLAISNHQEPYQRANGDGLIIRTDPHKSWKSLRVCNPTVIHWKNEFWMWYQAISKEGFRNVSIGFAKSKDGLKWDSNENPALSWSDMKDLDPKFREDGRAGVCEPSILIEDDKLKMWFVYRNLSHRGNTIYYAESGDGRDWKMFPHKILSGNQFGNCDVDYPQVLKEKDGYKMYFSIKNHNNGVFGIFTMTSTDGMCWENLTQLLPKNDYGFGLEVRQYLGVTKNWSKMRPLNFLNYMIAKSIFARSNYFFGYAHPHVMASNGKTDILFHGYHACRRGMWLDIGRFEVGSNGQAKNFKVVLSPSKKRGSWDSFFVGDPFLLKV
jgi:hypothetical protein